LIGLIINFNGASVISIIKTFAFYEIGGSHGVGVTPYGLVGRYDVSEEHTASIIRAALSPLLVLS
jgi:hypothetical protein